MKAKEYFEKYLNENQDEEKTHRVVLIFFDLFYEVKEIQIMRKAQSNSAMIAILNEQNTKANSFIKKVNEIDDLGIKNDAFKIFISHEMPDLSKMIGWS